MDLTIVIPAYNEEHRILSTLLEICCYVKINGVASYEVLVVDDGSLDRTSEVVATFAQSNPNIQLITLQQNKGKGFAVKTGILAATKEFVLFTDADGSTPIAEVERLFSEMNHHKADIAIGSRAKPSSVTHVEARSSRKFIGRIFNLAANLIAVPGIMDTQCGFKLFKREVGKRVFEKQRFERFSFDIEILRIAQRAGYKIVEVPVNWHHVTGSKVNVVKDGLRMLFDTVKIALIHR